ncbi:MAG: hypothetical protein KAT37_01775 [Candidatus Aenigmarchaeota archaeon]|nr:hypothetical protein [Candidatus Aenigmarchaeota archaeon]
MNGRGETWDQKLSKPFSQSVKNWTPEMIATPEVAKIGMGIDEIQKVQDEYKGTFGMNDYGGTLKRDVDLNKSPEHSVMKMYQ